MTTIQKILATGGVAVSIAIAVYSGSITGANYPSAILMHLVDIVQGNRTTTAVSTNAPNWSIGQQLAAPILRSIATSSNATAASGLASSTPYYFAIAALDGNGTTTISNTLNITTDASTTKATPENIVLRWPTVQGATGYAVYFSTTTAALNQYFYATSTSAGVGQFTFSTSTGSLAGSNALTDTTAFSTLFNPLGASFINGNNGTATSSPVASTTALHVNGNIDAISTATTSACYNQTVGQMFYNTANDILWLCKTTGWAAVK